MNKSEYKLIMIIGLLIFYIYTAQYMERDYWHDEAFQYLFSQEPIGYIMDSNDVHPPMFYLITKGIMLITNNLYALRLIMFGFMILAIYQFYLLMKEQFGYKTAYLSSFLFATSLTYMNYAVEFRSYAFAVLLTIMQIRAFNKKHWSYIIYSLMMVYTHYMTALILFAQAIYVLIKQDKRFYQYFAIIVVSCIPLAVYMIRTLPKIQSLWFKDINLISLISTFSYIVSPPAIQNFMLPILVIGFALYSLKHFNKKLLIYGMYILIPIITMFAVSQVFPFYHHRYFLFGGVFIFTFAGYGLNKIKDSDLMIYLVAVYLIFLINAIYMSLPPDTEIQESALAIKADWNSTQTPTIAHRTPFSQSPYKIYYPEAENVLISPLNDSELFTAGGAVITNHYHDPIPGIDYWVSADAENGTVIYEKGGLYVTKTY